MALVATLFGPSRVRTTVGPAKQRVEIIETTDYPFSEQIHFRFVLDAPDCSSLLRENSSLVPNSEDSGQRSADPSAPDQERFCSYEPPVQTERRAYIGVAYESCP